MANEYTPHIQAAIAADATRQQWTLAQWRAYWLEDVQGVKAMNLTYKDILNLLGPVRGNEVLASLEATYPHIVRMLQPTEGGIDMRNPHASSFIDTLKTGGIILQQEQDLLTQTITTTGKRNELLDLPDPRESIIEDALS